MLAAALQATPQLPSPNIDWSALSPLLILVGGAMVLLVVSSLSRTTPGRGVYAVYTVVVAAASMLAAARLWADVHDKGPFLAVNNAVAVDGFALFLTMVIGASVILAALLADGYFEREGLQGAEPYVLLLLSASGGVIMASANDLIVIFLGLEILSIAVYILAAMHLRRMQSLEAGMKYFVLGAFSSAFLLYGIALVYGATGSTSLAKVGVFASDTIAGNGSVALPHGTPGLLLAGFALLLVGLGFKVAAVPFHAWTPDVYQGSPTPSVAYMASGVKAAGFAAMLRIFDVAFIGYRDDWRPVVFALAVVTLVVGAMLAIVQTDVKRMLAYSSIAHAGFILLGVQAGTQLGISAALFYLAAYTFMVAGSFGVVSVLPRDEDGNHSISTLQGLSQREPLLAFVFTVFLLAQLGVPLTSGFFAKFYVLEAAVDAKSWSLAVIAMVTAVISAFLYLRIVLTMYGDPAGGPSEARPHRLAIGNLAKLSIGVAFAFTVIVGFLPGPIASMSQDATPVDPAGPPSREARPPEGPANTTAAATPAAPAAPQK